MKRRMKTIFDSLPDGGGIPEGRIRDVAARMSPSDIPRVALKFLGMFRGWDAYRFTTREEALAFIEAERQGPPPYRWKMLDAFVAPLPR